MHNLCAAVVGLLAIGFSSGTPTHEELKELTDLGCSSTQAFQILNLSPKPAVKTVTGWLKYFHSDAGGAIVQSDACDNALKVFDGTYFKGRDVDLTKFTKWVQFILTTLHTDHWHDGFPSEIAAANAIAQETLSKPHPLLEDVKPLSSPETGCSFSRAYSILEISPRPLLEEVHSWLKYFASDIGGHFDKSEACVKADTVLRGPNFDRSHKDLALFKEWVEYFYSDMGGDAKTYKSANEKAVEVLSSPHPNLAVIKMWVTYLASEHGRYDHHYQAANVDVFQRLSKPHPCLEDLKEWARFFRSAQGGSLIAAQALVKAEGILQESHPALEELKKTAEHLFSPGGGYPSHKASVAKALEVGITKHHEPVLSDTKVCEGEGYAEATGKTSIVSIILAFILTVGGFGCIGIALFYKCSDQARSQFSSGVSPLPLSSQRRSMQLPFVIASPSDQQVEMNISATSTRQNKDDALCGSCTACGAVKI